MPRKTAAWATLVACLDLFLKLYPGLREGPLVPGVLEIHRTVNTGVAFGMMPGLNGLVTLGGAVMIVVLALYVRREIPHGIQAAGFALLLGGAAGNLADRLLHGFVHDWLMFSFVNFPVFNLADVGLTVGAVLVALSLLKPEAAP